MPTVAKRKPGRPAKTDKVPEQAPSDEPKKSKRSGRSLTVWLPTELRETLDAYAAAQRFPPELTAIVKEALEDFLRKENWPLPTYGQQEGGEE